MWWPKFSLAIRRWQYKRNIPEEKLDAFSALNTCWQSDPSATSNLMSAPWQQAHYLIVDTETSSLNADDGDLLSIGWVVVSNGEIKLNSAQHYYIYGSLHVGQSATIHQIRDCEIATGTPIDKVMDALLAALNNHILVCHHAPMDIAFLNKQCQKQYAAPLLMPTIDTLALEKKKRLQADLSLSSGALTLSQCRSRYGLPDHKTHNALTDAIATAELLLAHISHKGSRIQVKDLFV